MLVSSWLIEAKAVNPDGMPKSKRLDVSEYAKQMAPIAVVNRK